MLVSTGMTQNDDTVERSIFAMYDYVDLCRSWKVIGSYTVFTRCWKTPRVVQIRNALKVMECVETFVSWREFALVTKRLETELRRG